jgi:predicted DNA-binding WGR domain protein
VRRFYPALALFAVLLAFSVTVSVILKNDTLRVINPLEQAAGQLRGGGGWDEAEAAFEQARSYWNAKHHFYAFVVNQSRNNEIVVQWGRAESAFLSREQEAFLLENAALAAMLRQLVHDFEIKWYNIM